MPQMLGLVGDTATQAAQLSMMPGQAMTGGGQFYQNIAQQQLNAAQDRWNWERDQPYNRLSQYANLLSAAPNMGAGQIPNTTSPWAGALGGLGTGLQMASMWGSSPSSGLASYWTPGGSSPFSVT